MALLACAPHPVRSGPLTEHVVAAAAEPVVPSVLARACVAMDAAAAPLTPAAELPPELADRTRPCAAGADEQPILTAHCEVGTCTVWTADHGSSGGTCLRDAAAQTLAQIANASAGRTCRALSGHSPPLPG